MFVSAVCTGVFNPSPITSCDVAQGNTVGRLHYTYYVFRRSEMRTMASGASHDLCSPLEGTAQHYTLPRIVITIILDPSLPAA